MKSIDCFVLIASFERFLSFLITIKPYLYVLCAIVFELLGTMLLKPNNTLSPLLQIPIVGCAYTITFFCLSLALKSLPIGFVYACWSGIGIVAIAILGKVFYQESLDIAGWLGIGLILGGVLVLNILSKSAGH